jgi:hypothetical protein
VIDLACRDGGAWRRSLAILHGLAAAALVAWLLPAGPAATGVLAAAAGLLAAAAAGRRGSGPAAPRLGFDGRAWRVDGQPASPPRIVLDLGGWMLLHLGRRCWAPVSVAGAGAPWPALRAALYSSPPPLDRPEAGRRP